MGETYDDRITSLEKMVNEREERTKERFANLVQTTASIANQLEKRLDGMNEFRASLADTQARFLTKEVHGEKHNQLSDQIRINTNRLSKIEEHLVTIQVEQATRKEAAIEKNQYAGTAYYQVASVGLVIAFIVSIVTVAFNLVVYIHHP